MADMKKPKKAKVKPKRITTKAPPGGNLTPGAKAARKTSVDSREGRRATDQDRFKREGRRLTDQDRNR